MHSTLLDKANKWIGHGKYLIEIDAKKTNENRHQFSDFIILFGDYFDSFEKGDEDERYLSKNFSMNCWQFVLLCMYEAQLIDGFDIKKLYFHSDSLKKPVPYFFGPNPNKQPSVGDIIVFRTRFCQFSHVAICCSITETHIGLIDIINGTVRTINQRIFSLPDMYSLDPNIVALNIKSLKNFSIINNTFAESLCICTIGVICGFIIYHMYSKK